MPVAYVRLVLVLTGSLWALGCSAKDQDRPELGRVNGIVSLDGKPLAKALVVFAPEAGRSSAGVTDSAGRYELQYLHNVKGAVIGHHKVQITTYYEDEDSVAALKAKETIPARFNSKTTLTANVEDGEESIDFDLQSK